MNSDVAAGTGGLLRGHAWHVYPDPATPGAYDGDSPFDLDGTATDAARPPDGVVAFWTVGGKLPTLRNQVEDRAYLVLTRKLEPPKVSAGWGIEPARLATSFEIDQHGRRSVRLIRVLHTNETPWGPVQDCEFQVDRG